MRKNISETYKHLEIVLDQNQRCVVHEDSQDFCCFDILFSDRGILSKRQVKVFFSALAFFWDAFVNPIITTYNNLKLELSFLLRLYINDKIFSHFGFIYLVKFFEEIFLERIFSEKISFRKLFPLTTEKLTKKCN